MIITEWCQQDIMALLEACFPAIKMAAIAAIITSKGGLTNVSVCMEKSQLFSKWEYRKQLVASCIQLCILAFPVPRLSSRPA
jgi:hypothetical protein